MAVCIVWLQSSNIYSKNYIYVCVCVWVHQMKLLHWYYLIEMYVFYYLMIVTHMLNAVIFCCCFAFAYEFSNYVKTGKIILLWFYFLFIVILILLLEMNWSVTIIQINYSNNLNKYTWASTAWQTFTPLTYTHFKSWFINFINQFFIEHSWFTILY